MKEEKRIRIAKRAALELNDGDNVNLGIRKRMYHAPGSSSTADGNNKCAAKGGGRLATRDEHRFANLLGQQRHSWVRDTDGIVHAHSLAGGIHWSTQPGTGYGGQETLCVK